MVGVLQKMDLRGEVVAQAVGLVVLVVVVVVVGQVERAQS